MLKTKVLELKDQKWLETKYVNEQLSVKDISDLLRISQWSVRNALRFHKISTRSRGDCLRLRHQRKPVALKYEKLGDREWLYQKYITEKKSAHEIARIVGGASNQTVENALFRLGIKTGRIRPPRVIGGSCYEQLNNKEWLYQKYIVEKLSTLEIGRLVNGNKNTCGSVFQALKRLDIPIRSHSEGHLIKREGDGFSLNQKRLELIHGALLGDATLGRSINKNSKAKQYGGNPCFRQSGISKGFIELIAQNLFGDKWHNRVKGPFIQKGGFGHKAQPFYHVSSLRHPELMSIFEDWYPEWNNFKKIVPDNILVTPISLLHWFLGDGWSYWVNKKYKNPKWNKRCRRILFATNCFRLEHLQMLSQKIKDTFDLRVKPRFHQRNGKIGGTGYEMELSELQIDAFYEIIGPPPVPSLAYKWK